MELQEERKCISLLTAVRHGEDAYISNQFHISFFLQSEKNGAGFLSSKCPQGRVEHSSPAATVLIKRVAFPTHFNPYLIWP